ncbi:MAG: GNAT family N-acetyltransferase [Deinococcales bacterium]
MIDYQINASFSNEDLNELFASAWPSHTFRDFSKQLNHSLAYVVAIEDELLLGFVNIAWDGGIHAFILDTTVRPSHQRQGIGRRLVHEAIDLAQSRGMQWLHVDFEAGLEPFYHTCGFKHTKAGLIDLAAWH